MCRTSRVSIPKVGKEPALRSQEIKFKTEQTIHQEKKQKQNNLSFENTESESVDSPRLSPLIKHDTVRREEKQDRQD